VVHLTLRALWRASSEVGELLIPEPAPATRAGEDACADPAAAWRAVVPRRPRRPVFAARVTTTAGGNEKLQAQRTRQRPRRRPRVFSLI